MLKKCPWYAKPCSRPEDTTVNKISKGTASIGAPIVVKEEQLIDRPREEMLTDRTNKWAEHMAGGGEQASDTASAKRRPTLELRSGQQE